MPIKAVLHALQARLQGPSAASKQSATHHLCHPIKGLPLGSGSAGIDRSLAQPVAQHAIHATQLCVLLACNACLTPPAVKSVSDCTQLHTITPSPPAALSWAVQAETVRYTNQHASSPAALQDTRGVYVSNTPVQQSWRDSCFHGLSTPHCLPAGGDTHGQATAHGPKGPQLASAA